MKELTTKQKRIYVMFFQALFCLGVFASVFLMMIGMYLHTVGFHNIDVGYNLRYLNAKYNMTFHDCVEVVNGTCNIDFTAQEGYNLGINQQERGLFLMIFGSIAFVAELYTLIEASEKYGKYHERLKNGK